MACGRAPKTSLWKPETAARFQAGPAPVRAGPSGSRGRRSAPGTPPPSARTRAAVIDHARNLLCHPLGAGNHPVGVDESFQILTAQGVADQPFDGTKIGKFLRRYEADGRTFSSGPRRSSDTMHVDLGVRRQIIIYHMGNIDYIDTAGDDVGGDQYPDLVNPSRVCCRRD